MPRITPSLASMRWMVGSDRPDSSARAALVEAEQRPGGAHLGGRDHASDITSPSLDRNVTYYPSKSRLADKWEACPPCRGRWAKAVRSGSMPRCRLDRHVRGDAGAHSFGSLAPPRTRWVSNRSSGRTNGLIALKSVVDRIRFRQHDGGARLIGGGLDPGRRLGRGQHDRPIGVSGPPTDAGTASSAPNCSLVSRTIRCATAWAA